jgi:hypothetical protein
MLIRRFNRQNRLDNPPAKSCELHRFIDRLPSRTIGYGKVTLNEIHNFLFQWSSKATAVSVWTPSISQPTRLDFTRSWVLGLARMEPLNQFVAKTSWQRHATTGRLGVSARLMPGVPAELWGLTGGWKLQQLGVTWAIFNWLTKGYHLVN